MQLEHRTRLPGDLVLDVGVAEKRERAAIRARGRLDHVREITACVRIRLLIVEVAQVLPA